MNLPFSPKLLPAARARFRTQLALGRFWGCLGSGAGFRRAYQSVNGVLTAFLCVMMSAGAGIFGKGPACG